MNDLSAMEKVIIPVEGQGIVDEELALKIFQEYAAVIENRNMCIEFKIGKNITRAAPEFWSGLLSPILGAYYREARDSNTREKRIEILKLVDKRFSLGYEEPDIDRYFKFADEYNRRGRAIVSHAELSEEMGKAPPIPEHLKAKARDCARIRHTFTGMILDYRNRLSALAYPDMEPVEPADVLRGWVIAENKAG